MTFYDDLGDFTELADLSLCHCGELGYVECRAFGCEAPQRDCARPHGIPFDRGMCPPDDELQDEICAARAEIDAAVAEVRP